MTPDEAAHELAEKKASLKKIQLRIKELEGYLLSLADEGIDQTNGDISLKWQLRRAWGNDISALRFRQLANLKGISEQALGQWKYHPSAKLVAASLHREEITAEELETACPSEWVATWRTK